MADRSPWFLVRFCWCVKATVLFSIVESRSCTSSDCQASISSHSCLVAAKPPTVLQNGKTFCHKIDVSKASDASELLQSLVTVWRNTIIECHCRRFNVFCLTNPFCHIIESSLGKCGFLAKSCYCNVRRTRTKLKKIATWLQYSVFSFDVWLLHWKSSGTQTVPKLFLVVSFCQHSAIDLPEMSSGDTHVKRRENDIISTCSFVWFRGKVFRPQRNFRRS